MHPKLILASASPRRRQLLQNLAYPFQIEPSGIDEAMATASPRQLALALAMAKASAVLPKGQDPWIVLGADTVIDLDGAVLGKPQAADHARQMLRLLRGRGHLVITALAVVSSCGTTQSMRVETEVEMSNYSDRQIDAYVKSGEPLDKAGSYAIQGKGGPLVRSFRGCYTNIVGLPLCATFSLLVPHLPLTRAKQPLCCLPNGSPCPRLSSERAH